ncbi:histidine triad nucleotide-binding protein [Pseudohongiella acticola]|uniref:Histidine triad nucleotide-binding protein n=1 Tax=Pseudohongiella acticola TaxID=1524254 RepID=A0A1E8CJR1_9GAMM|nr:histidine triad nucleotide-binding protein [Pseudohongiella acticola]OFE12634.1 histidine triad nucleotide-binding protein [Pseudohongiella acticola]
MSNDCLFCRIAAGDIPSQEVYSDEHVYAFHDINPTAPTHILVIPRKHLNSVCDAGPDDEALMGKLLLTGQQIAQKQGVASDGFRLVINTGDQGGQTVHHIHLHILGGRQMTWPPG